MAFLSEQARTSRRSPRKPAKGDLVAKLGIVQPKDKLDHHLYIYRNPAFNGNEKKESNKPQYLYDWRKVSPTTQVYNTARMYGCSDLVLYSGPTLKSSGRNVRVCFVAGQIYQVGYSRHHESEDNSLIRLLPSGNAHAGKSIPPVLVTDIRHISAQREGERARILADEILLAQLEEINERYVGVVPSFDESGKIKYNKRIYVLHCFWYKEEYVRKVCTTLGHDIDDNPGLLLRTDSVIEALFDALWEDDILAKVEAA